MERVHIDILGPFTESNRGNQYVLMIVDQFTKWLECFPLPLQSAELTAKAVVDRFISRFGCPLEIHTDQGRNFDGKLFSSVCKLLEVTKTRTTWRQGFRIKNPLKRSGIVMAAGDKWLNEEDVVVKKPKAPKKSRKPKKPKVTQASGSPRKVTIVLSGAPDENIV